MDKEAEQIRLDALERINIVGSGPEAEYDRIVQLAQGMFGFPYVWISFLDHEKEWFKSSAGLSRTSVPIRLSLPLRDEPRCSQGIWSSHNQPEGQALLRTLFPGTAFENYSYYAAPVRSDEGVMIGTVALLDSQPRSLDASEQQRLTLFSELVERELHRRNDCLSPSEIESRVLEKVDTLKKSLAFSNVGVWSWEIDSGKVAWSEEAIKVLGTPEDRSEVRYEDFLSLLHPQDVLKVQKAVAKSVKNAADYDVEHRIIKPSGEVSWVQNKGGLIRDHSGRPVRMLGVVIDINRRKRLESDFLANESKFHSLFDLSPIGIALNDMDGRFIEANQAFLEMVGYTFETLQSLSYWDLIPDSYSEDEAIQLESLKQSGRYGPYEKQYLHQDGSLVDVRLNGVLIEGLPGQQYIWSLAEDVTVANRIKQRAERAHSLLLDAQKLAKLGHWEANLATGELFWSETIFEIFGFDCRTFSPSVAAFKKTIHPDDVELVEQSEVRAKETGKHDVVHRIVRPDGEVRYVHELASLVENAHGEEPVLIGTVQDITELQQAEHFLDLFQKVFDASQQGLGITDKYGHLIYSNAAHDRIHGYEPGELEGEHIIRFFSEENQNWVLQKVEESVKQGKGWSGLIPVVRKNGHEVMTSANINLVKTPGGEVEYIFNIMSDYTAEQARQNELLAAKEEAERASQAKSEFLSGMSHELRTPMNAVLGFAQLMKYDEALSPDHRDSVEEIIDAGNHLLELINDVLDLSKVESGNIEMDSQPVELQRLLHQALELVRPLASQKDISISSPENLDYRVQADFRRLKQVLLNLLSNAVKYNQPGGWVELKVEPTSVNRLRIVVTDNGLGISEDKLSQLFQPFNRLGREKSGIEGTGVGLSLTKKLVESMGGEIGVSSKSGRGSRFWIELPRTDGP